MKNETPNHYLRNGKAFHDEMLEKYGPEKVAIFFMINAEKYRSRAGKKDASPKKIVEDIEKALHCEDLQAQFQGLIEAWPDLNTYSETVNDLLYQKHLLQDGPFPEKTFTSQFYNERKDPGTCAVAWLWVCHFRETTPNSLEQIIDSEAFNVKVKAEEDVQKCSKPTSDALPRIEAIQSINPRLWPFNEYKALVTVIIDQASCFKDKDKYPHDSWLEKMQAQNVSPETAVIHWFADLLSGKVKSPVATPDVVSNTVNEWTLPAYIEEVNKFLEMLGYEPLSGYKLSHAWAAGQSPRMFVEQTLGTMINGKTSVYEVSQQIEKASDDERK